MKLKTFLYLLDAETKERREHLDKLLNRNPRNDTLQTNKDYFDGHHWWIDSTGRGNTTRSGKKIWGKSKKANSYDAYQRNVVHADEIAFEAGQLQSMNYIKTLTNIYKEYVAGGENEGVKVIVEDNEELQNELDVLWEDIDVFLKEEVARAVINTVAIGRLMKDGDGYKIETVEASSFYPIYEGKQRVGSICAYNIDKMDAKAYGVEVKDDTAVYAKAFYNYEDKWWFVEMVNGSIVNDNAEPEVLQDELAFDPFEMVANLDHPFHRFDDYTLEDSEIFSWIDKNDNLNASLTMEFLTNLFLSTPPVQLDWDVIQKMNFDINDPAFQQSLRSYQKMPMAVDSTPIKVVEGQSIPDSFYKGMANTKDSLFEDASIPQFIVTGQIPSGIAVETIEMGMQMLRKKIEQKREQLEKLITNLTTKYLLVTGRADSEREARQLIRVEMPPVTGLSTSDMIQHFKELNGVFPKRYIQEQILELMNRSSDMGQVKEMEQQDIADLTGLVETSRRSAQAQRELNRDLLERTTVRQQEAQLDAQIEALS